MESLTFISHRAPSIATTNAHIFPNVYHGVYGSHVLSNIMLQKNIILEGCKILYSRRLLLLYVSTTYEETYLMEVFKRSRSKKCLQAYLQGYFYNLMTSNNAKFILALS